MEPLAPHEKLFVDTDFLEEDGNHGSIDCHRCHGGDPKDPDWRTAHKDLIKDPTYPDSESACGDCHDVENYKKSLHVSLEPYRVTMKTRGGNDKAAHKKLDKAFDTYCGQCHASCGGCHISRPASADGGLLDGHIFQKQPPMKQTCTACHGSRIGKEYFGENEGLKPDIHHEKYMKCGKCHTAHEMHGDGKAYEHRYEVENGPKCEDCHKEIYGDHSENVKIHTTHRDKTSCFVCHSQSYMNCSTCHMGNDQQGNGFFKTEPSWMDFKIGLNPSISDKHPEKFVTLRHVPVGRDSFKFYGEDDLKDFDAVSTWKMTTPHNIRRKTVQNESCNACHGNLSLFLINKDVEEEEKKANKSVIVGRDLIPKKIEQESAGKGSN